MRIAKVLSTCFKRGRVREKTELLGDPQDIFHIVKILQLLKKL